MRFTSTGARHAEPGGLAPAAQAPGRSAAAAPAGAERPCWRQPPLLAQPSRRQAPRRRLTGQPQHVTSTPRLILVTHLCSQPACQRPQGGCAVKRFKCFTAQLRATRAQSARTAAARAGDGDGGRGRGRGRERQRGLPGHVQQAHGVDGRGQVAVQVAQGRQQQRGRVEDDLGLRARAAGFDDDSAGG